MGFRGSRGRTWPHSLTFDGTEAFAVFFLRRGSQTCPLEKDVQAQGSQRSRLAASHKDQQSMSPL